METNDKLELLEILNDKIKELEEQTNEKDIIEGLDVEMVSYWILLIIQSMHLNKYILDKNKDSKQEGWKTDQEARIAE